MSESQRNHRGIGEGICTDTDCWCRDPAQNKDHPYWGRQEHRTSNPRVSVEQGFYILEDEDGRTVREATSSEKRLGAEIERLTAALKRAEEWRDYYRAQWHGDEGHTPRPADESKSGADRG